MPTQDVIDAKLALLRDINPFYIVYMSIYKFIAAIVHKHATYKHYYILLDLLNSLWTARWMLTSCKYHLELVLKPDSGADVKCYNELVDELKADLIKFQEATSDVDSNSAIPRIRALYVTILTRSEREELIEELKGFGEYELPENTFPH